MIGERLCYSMIFLSPREGKFKLKKNQLFSWLKKEGKIEANGPSDGWTVGPVSPRGVDCWPNSNSFTALGAA